MHVIAYLVQFQYNQLHSNTRGYECSQSPDKRPSYYDNPDGFHRTDNTSFAKFDTSYRLKCRSSSFWSWTYI